MSSIRREIRTLLRLAAPVAVTQVALVFLGVVDTLLVGPLGRDAIGGIALGNSLSFFLIVFAFGVLTTVDAFVAQSYGAGDLGRCGEHLWQGLWVAAGLSLPITLWLLDFEPMLRLMGQDEAAIREAVRYLDGVAWSVPPMLLLSALRGYLNGFGRMRPFMIIAVVANVVNAAADWALIYGWGPIPALGVYGAGLATTISRAFMLALTAWVVWSGVEGARVRAPRAPRLREIGRMLSIGVPTGLTFAAEVGVFSAALILMGWLGRAELAAHQIALNLCSLTFMVPLGISVAASVRVGQAVGRRAWELARIAGVAAYIMGVGFMAASALGLAVLAGPLARLYRPDAEVFAIAVTLIRIAALFQISDGGQVIGAGCLRGANDTRVAFLVNLVGHWGVGLPGGWWLAFRAGAGAAGLWYGLTASLTFVAVFLAIRFFSGRWRAAFALGAGARR